MFDVYILESAATKKWYYGFTERLKERIKEHNSNNKHFTGGKGPWILIFKRCFIYKNEAMFFENLLKKSKNKIYLQRAYAEFFI